MTWWMRRRVRHIMARAKSSLLKLSVVALVAHSAQIAWAQELPVLGQIISGRQTPLSFPRDGVLSEVFVEPTDVVRAGDVIATLSCDSEAAQLDAATAAVAVRELSYRSKAQLLEYSSATELEVQLAEAEWQQAVAEVEIYRAQLRECELVAPFSGAVSEVYVDDYAFVPTGEPVVRLIDTVATYFEFMAPLSWASRDMVGEELLIAVDEVELHLRGRVDRVYPEVEAVSKTVRMRAALIDAPDDVAVGLPGVVSRVPE